jgi:hypothetical protein
MRFVCWLGLVIALLGACPAYAVSYDDVLARLEGRHWQPPEDFATLGAGEVVHLQRIAEEGALPNFYRQRALRMLERYPTTAVLTFLQNFVQREQQPLPLVRQGLQTLRVGFAEAYPAEVEQVALDFIDHANPQVRVIAAQTIRPLNMERFEAFLAQEAETWVRQAAQQ